MKNPYINLRNCNRGDILIAKNGSLLTYMEYRQDMPYPHIVDYNNKNLGAGSRNDDGSVFSQNKKDEDLDIVLVIPKDEFKGKLAKYLVKESNAAFERLLSLS